VLGAGPGVDWRPLELTAVPPSEQAAPWWSELPVRADDPLRTSGGGPGFVGWLRRRLRPKG